MIKIKLLFLLFVALLTMGSPVYSIFVTENNKINAIINYGSEEHIFIVDNEDVVYFFNGGVYFDNRPPAEKFNLTLHVDVFDDFRDVELIHQPYPYLDGNFVGSDMIDAIDFIKLNDDFSFLEVTIGFNENISEYKYYPVSFFIVLKGAVSLDSSDLSGNTYTFSAKSLSKETKLSRRTKFTVDALDENGVIYETSKDRIYPFSLSILKKFKIEELSPRENYLIDRNLPTHSIFLKIPYNKTRNGVSIIYEAYESIFTLASTEGRIEYAASSKLFADRTWPITLDKSTLFTESDVERFLVSNRNNFTTYAWENPPDRIYIKFKEENQLYKWIKNLSPITGLLGISFLALILLIYNHFKKKS